MTSPFPKQHVHCEKKCTDSTEFIFGPLKRKQDASLQIHIQK